MKELRLRPDVLSVLWSEVMKKDLTLRLLPIFYTYEINFDPKYSELLTRFANITREINLTEGIINELQNLCAQLASAKQRPVL